MEKFEDNSENDEQESTSNRMKLFFFESQQILTKKALFHLALLFSVRYRPTFDSILIILLLEIFRNSFTPLSVFPNVDVLSGYILMSFEIAGIFSSVFAGKVFAHFKKHLIQIAASQFMLFISSCVFFVGYYFRNLVTLLVSFILLSLFVGFPCSPLYDAVVKDLYPHKPGVISAILSTEYFALTMIVV